MPNQSGRLFFVDNNGIIKNRKLDFQGNLVGRERAAFNSPKNRTPLRSPVVAFSTNAKGTHGLLLATEDAEGTIIWAQPLDLKGNPVGSPVEVYSTSIDESIGDVVLTALPGKPANALFHFSWFGSLQQISSTGTVLSAGIVQLKLTVD